MFQLWPVLKEARRRVGTWMWPITKKGRGSWRSNKASSPVKMVFRIVSISDKEVR